MVRVMRIRFPPEVWNGRPNVVLHGWSAHEENMMIV